MSGQMIKTTEVVDGVYELILGEKIGFIFLQELSSALCPLCVERAACFC